MKTSNKTPKGVIRIETSDDTQLEVQLSECKTIGADYSKQEQGVCITLRTDTGSGDDGTQTTFLTGKQLKTLIATLKAMLQGIEPNP